MNPQLPDPTQRYHGPNSRYHHVESPYVRQAPKPNTSGTAVMVLFAYMMFMLVMLLIIASA